MSIGWVVALVAGISAIALWLQLRRERQVKAVPFDEARASLLAEYHAKAQAVATEWKNYHDTTVQRLAEFHTTELERARVDALARSKAVTVGKVTEHLIPYFPGFPYNPKDCRFLGSPVDLIVFDGLDEGQLRGIVLVEIKTGQYTTLSERERQVRDVTRARGIAWQLLTPRSLDGQR